MFSIKQNVLQTAALLKAYGVRHIVLSPGSRNAPLMQTFSQDDFFHCHLLVDERNAAFYALGIIQCLGQPVAVCCTSGSALLNYAPAVSEAFYSKLPLIVLSADRAQAWIGQMDGQTMPQSDVFGTLVRKAVNLPEVDGETALWHCNRLLNEALIAATANGGGPVHINIPLSEPLFDYSQVELPQVRKINRTESQLNINIKPFAGRWQSLPKRMIIVGQHAYNKELIDVLESIAAKADCVILAEHLSNCVSPSFIGNFDALLYALDDEAKAAFSPDLLITFGGHIVSKRIKHFLRQNKPTEHWHIDISGDLPDLYQSLTDLIDTKPVGFLNSLAQAADADSEKAFQNKWNDASSSIPEPSSATPFGDVAAIGAFVRRLPENSLLHLANSSSVRNAQLFAVNKSVKAFCNRGINGIEGSLPTAVGFAAVCDRPVYLLVGDLSFFYGLNALWNISHIRNLRILLINNGGGGIFHLLPGLNKSASLDQYVAAHHNADARQWAAAAGLNYLSATNADELEDALKIFTAETDGSVILEVKVDMETSKKAFQGYYHSLKGIR